MIIVYQKQLIAFDGATQAEADKLFAIMGHAINKFNEEGRPQSGE